jgi:Ca2+-binding EF-hand superfamily protein
MTSIRLPLFLSLACCLALLSAGVARAEDGDLPPTSEFFDEYDTNQDGCVTPDEFRGSSEIFKLLDKNGDGSIKPDELGLPADFKPDPRRKRRQPGGAPGARDGKGAARMQKFLQKLAQMDTDKDGRVSKAEYTGPEGAFDRLDRNKDGFLDKQDRRQPKDGAARGGKGGRDGAGKDGGGLGEELREKVKKRAADQFARMDANGDGEVTLPELQKILLQRAARQAGGGDGQRRGGRRGRVNPRMLASWDRNKDGKVSADEFPGRQELFAKLDRDGDGFLTQADLEAPGGDGPGGARKAPVTEKGGDVIQSMDTDDDGRLHRAEFRGSSEDWARLDRNKDGWITRDELK